MTNSANHYATPPTNKTNLYVKVSRFYVLLSGAAVASYGVVYFRQDQPHIDLFVFFSVFFSCFFLFLAACVLLWKAKQALDRRRSRHRRQIEMHDMASRPFAAVLVHVPPPPRRTDTTAPASRDTVPPGRLLQHGRSRLLKSGPAM